MDVPSHDELIARIKAFCERHGIGESRFGREALGNPAFVSNLRSPRRSPTLDTLNKVADFMADRDAQAVTREHDVLAALKSEVEAREAALAERDAAPRLCSGQA